MRGELEAAGLLRAEDTFELLRAEPASELFRAAEFELLRAAPELELRRLELAAVAPLLLAAGRLRLPAFGVALRFVLVWLATSVHSTAGVTQNTSMQHRLRRTRISVVWTRDRCRHFQLEAPPRAMHDRAASGLRGGSS